MNIQQKAECSLVFRALKTCFKMLRKRGYYVDEDNFNMTSEGFYNRFVGQQAVLDRKMIEILCKKRDQDESIFVFFAPSEKLSKASVEEYYKKMVNNNVNRAILVISMPLTVSAKTSLKQFASKGVRIEIFTDKELLVDITEHKLVPEHVLLTEEQKRELLARYRLKENQLPRIQTLDPVARYLGLKARDVVKIERPSETAGRYITYRICY